MRTLTSEEIKKVDTALLEKLSLTQVLEDVGKSLYSWFENNIPKSQKVGLLVGPGNNGNDTLALACKLLENSYKIRVFCLENNNLKTLSQERAFFLQPLQSVISNGISSSFDGLDVIVDGIFGIGLDREIEGQAAQWILSANAIKGVKKIAIDVPSGMRCDTGEVFKVCFKADWTLAISTYKLSHFLYPSQKKCGELEIISVKKIDEMAEKVESQFCSLPSFVEFFKKISFNQDPSKHKYDRGKVGVVLCQTYPGACLLAAQAAHWSGAGYVEVYCPEPLIMGCQIQYPHLVFKAYKDQKNLLKTLETSGCDALILGPGWDLGFLDISVLASRGQKIVLDAGLLTPETVEMLSSMSDKEVVLTPHGGELGKMGLRTNTKVERAWELASKTKSCVVAKGNDTLVIDENLPKYITTWNSPSLAVAGSGDVLSGIIGSFLSQGLSPKDAACAAVDFHRQLGQLNKYRSSPIALIEGMSNLLNTKFEEILI